MTREIVAPGSPAAPVDLLVLEAAAPTDGAEHVLALGAGLSAVSVTVLEPLLAPALMPTDPTEPLTHYVDPTGLHIQKANRLEIPEGGRALLTSADGPVAVLLPGEDIAALGWSLADSDLALRLDFAHLIANVVEWAQPEMSELPPAEGLLSVSQTQASVARAIPLPDHTPRRADHRLAILLVGLLLLAEWGLQARSAS